MVPTECSKLWHENGGSKLPQTNQPLGWLAAGEVVWRVHVDDGGRYALMSGIHTHAAVKKVGQDIFPGREKKNFYMDMGTVEQYYTSRCSTDLGLIFNGIFTPSLVWKLPLCKPAQSVTKRLKTIYRKT